MSRNNNTETKFKDARDRARESAKSSEYYLLDAKLMVYTLFTKAPSSPEQATKKLYTSVACGESERERERVRREENAARLNNRAMYEWKPNLINGYTGGLLIDGWRMHTGYLRMDVGWFGLCTNKKKHMTGTYEVKNDASDIR